MPTSQEFNEQFDLSLQAFDKRIADLLANLNALATVKGASKSKIKALQLDDLVNEIRIYQGLIQDLAKKYEIYKKGPNDMLADTHFQDDLTKGLSDIRGKFDVILGSKAIPISSKPEEKRSNEEHTLLTLLRNAISRQDLKVTPDMKMARENRSQSVMSDEYKAYLEATRVALGAPKQPSARPSVVAPAGKFEGTIKIDPRRDPAIIDDFEKRMASEASYLSIVLERLKTYCEHNPKDKVAATLNSQCIGIAKKFNGLLTGLDAEKKDQKSGFMDTPIQSFSSSLNSGIKKSIDTLVDENSKIPKKTQGLFSKGNAAFVEMMTEIKNSRDELRATGLSSSLKAIEVAKFEPSSAPRKGNN